MEIVNHLHEVCIPQLKVEVSQFNAKVKELFFPDDPLRQFRGQPSGRRCLLELQYLFPILQWAPKYNVQFFRSHVIFWLHLQALPSLRVSAMPGWPAYHPLLDYIQVLFHSVLGSSRDLAVGPVSIASLLVGSMLKAIVSTVNNPAIYLQLAFTATFFAGVFEASLRILRLGFIVDFMSRTTLVGFVAGSAVLDLQYQFSSSKPFLE